MSGTETTGQNASGEITFPASVEPRALLGVPVRVGGENYIVVSVTDGVVRAAPDRRNRAQRRRAESDRRRRA